MAILWFDVFENHPDFKNRGSSRDSQPAISPSENALLRPLATVLS
jgi:hypothetical protein